MTLKRSFLAVLVLVVAGALVAKVFSSKPQLPMLSYTAGHSYTGDWLRVDSFLKAGLPVEALALVDGIRKKAVAEHNHAQLVKCLMFHSSLSANAKEDGQKEMIAEVEEETARAPFPIKPLLQSMLAELYWVYYQDNRYQINQRTKLSTGGGADIATWDASAFTARVTALYLASLSNTDSLQRTSEYLYEDILNLARSPKSGNATLYDLLANRAIVFFSNTESELTQPVNPFVMEDPRYLGSDDDFLDIKISPADTLSNLPRALCLLQELTRSYTARGNTSALVFTNLTRLSLAMEHMTTEHKDSLYLLSLQALEKRFKDDTSSTMVGFEIARSWNELGNSYSPLNDTTYRWYKKKALAKCHEVGKRMPFTTGAGNCASLAMQIIHQQLSFKCEDVEVPALPFKILVNYANTDSLYLRVVSAQGIDPSKKNSLNGHDFLNLLLHKPALNQWRLATLSGDDNQAHATELAIPALNLGAYYVIASTHRDFNDSNGIVSYYDIQVSNLGYSKRETNGNDEYWVYDRTTGKPVSGARVQAFGNVYSVATSRYEPTLWGTVNTNADGLAVFQHHNNNESGWINIDDKNDHLHSVNYGYDYYSDNRADSKWHDKMFFFLDRAIYRPGQTLYFKALCLSNKDDQYKIEAGVSKTIKLYNVNGVVVAQKQFTTNKYGTIAGSFVLPNTGLNGMMNLNNERTFNVEDYKRPQFEVTFNPVKNSYRLGDKVTLTGKATSYSGAPVSDAVVEYHVNRQATFPYWYEWNVIRPGNAAELVTGHVKTDEKGEFTIEFTAQPDPTVNRSELPEYSYTASASVTDLNAETETTATSVSVGAVALRVELNVPENYSTRDTTQIRLETKNLNGEFEAAQGNIKIYRLRDNGRLLRNRPWTEDPDIFTMSETEFIQKFPLDIYRHEDRWETWQKLSLAADIPFDSKRSKAFHLPDFANWKEGRYVAELVTHDKYGVEVLVKKYFAVYDEAKNTMPVRSLWWVNPIRVTAEPGESAKVMIGSSEKDVRVLYEVSVKGKVIHSEWIQLSNSKKLIELPVKEEYRGGALMNFRMVRNDRFYNTPVTITVPFSNKELKMEFTTFRDKLKPGGKETWQVKISGPKGEKVAAEMLAAMYDASLDAFAANNYNTNIYDYNWSYYNDLNEWKENQTWDRGSSTDIAENRSYGWSYKYVTNDELNWFNMLSYYGNRYFMRTYRPTVRFVELVTKKSHERGGSWKDVGYFEKEANEETVGGSRALSYNRASTGAVTKLTEGDANAKMYDKTESAYAVGLVAESQPASTPPPPPAPRTNFSETAFFYPQLETDTAGNIIFSFTAPESLTRWKFSGIAYTQQLQFGFLTATAVTQKDLMVNTNAPRFLREGDEIELTAKVSSLSDKNLTGKAVLTLTDPYTNQNVTGSFGSISAVSFDIKSGQNTSVSWKLKVPAGLGAVSYRIMATAGNFSDGEEAPLPVLSNRMLVTETLPVHVKGDQQKTFTLDKLLHSGSSTTLSNHRLTFELSANPVWYAIQALPYMMEFPHECSEQLFNRYYANSLAEHIAGSSPRIQQVLSAWKGTDALQSNLEKNKELKQILLEESPWVLQGRSESESKKRIALLFDLNKMSAEKANALKKLWESQSSNGGWSWFKGMPPNRYITQYVVTGIGRLKNMGIVQLKGNDELFYHAKMGLDYLDAQAAADYRELLRNNPKLVGEYISDLEIQYLYTRSFFPSAEIPTGTRKAYDYYMEQARKYWLKQDKSAQAMIAIVMQRSGNTEVYNNILHSLDENAMHNEELGMYWKDNLAGYSCFEAPVETQALMIEAFSLNAKNEDKVDELRTWLLKQKQVQNWATTKATADACYALLLNGSNWLNSTEVPEVTIGNTRLSSIPNLPKPEAGTGYVRTSWDAKEIKPEMGKVTISKQSKGIAWGALYWQYFEQLDKITGAKTALQLDKKLFLQNHGSTGVVLSPVTGKTNLKPGDLVTVRVELRVDRDMDFVEMKDMRASCFEPVSVLSSYKYQGGLGYYESPRDAATYFFFDHLSKGTFVFEYSLRVSQKGDFSNGITTIQSMYAPEFSSHSEGVRVVVK